MARWPWILTLAEAGVGVVVESAAAVVAARGRGGVNKSGRRSGNRKACSAWTRASRSGCYPCSSSAPIWPRKWCARQPCTERRHSRCTPHILWGLTSSFGVTTGSPWALARTLSGAWGTTRSPRRPQRRSPCARARVTGCGELREALTGCGPWRTSPRTSRAAT